MNTINRQLSAQDCSAALSADDRPQSRVASNPLMKVLVSQDMRALVAIGFFVAYLATALIA